MLSLPTLAQPPPSKANENPAAKQTRDAMGTPNTTVTVHRTPDAGRISAVKDVGMMATDKLQTTVASWTRAKIRRARPQIYACRRASPGRAFTSAILARL